MCGMIAIETEQNPKGLEKYYIPYGLLFFSSRRRYQDSFQFYFRFKRVSEIVLIDSYQRTERVIFALIAVYKQVEDSHQLIYKEAYFLIFPHIGNYPQTQVDLYSQANNRGNNMLCLVLAVGVICTVMQVEFRFRLKRVRSLTSSDFI